MIFKLVKDGLAPESFIEHAIRTHAIAKFLMTHVKIPVDREKYLYASFFHDIGKLLIEKLGEPHTPLSEKALNAFKESAYYETILSKFNLSDLSSDPEVLQAIASHHDSKGDLGFYVAIADHIASTSSNDEIKNRFQNSTILHAFLKTTNFHQYNFYTITFPSFSKNELNAVGRLILLKLLFETLETISDVWFLYELKDGCRIATTLPETDLRAQLSQSFNQNLLKFISSQNLESFIGGDPQNYNYFVEIFPDELREVIFEVFANRFIDRLLRDTKQENLEQIGLSKEIFYQLLKEDFTFLPKSNAAMKKILQTKKELLQKKKPPAWVEHFADTDKRIIDQILETVGVDTEKLTYKDKIDPIICSYLVAINSAKSSKTKLSVDLTSFIAIDGHLNVETILARENVCANCGTFEASVPLSTLTLGFRQHKRETLFRGRNEQLRSTDAFSICPICHFESLLNLLLVGVTQGRQVRINPKTHFILYGLDIDRDLLESTYDEDKIIIEKLLQEFKITWQSVYTSRPEDFQIVLYSFINNLNTPSGPIDLGMTNTTYSSIFFSWIASRFNQKFPFIVSYCINCLPKFLSNQQIQFPNGVINLYSEIEHQFFEFVFSNINDYQMRRDYIIRYLKSPFIGLCVVFKNNRFIKYDDKIDELVMKLSENDKIYEIIDQIWETAKLGGALETSKNVGAFLGNFKGYVGDLDRVINRILKNEKITKENRQKILEIHEKLRTTLKALTDSERKLLRKQIQQTKYLFNSKKFYELSKNKGGN